tara:strand:+ start:671 stop:1312 length:642 start_codon:yes stop_codon:yes gene_type:complete
MEISIAILNFNRSKFLDRSLRSCLEQVTINKKVEIIVIDDNSKDDSLRFLSQFKKYIRIIKNTKNKGVGYCSNLAVKKAKGKYFLRVDSDDYINKFTTHIMSEVLDHNPNLSFVYSDHYRVDEKSIKQKIVRINNMNKLFLHGAGIMFRKKDIIEVGNYNKKLREAEDHELIKRLLLKKKKPFHIPVPLYRYYIHNYNLSKSGKRKKIIKNIQ